MVIQLQIIIALLVTLALAGVTLAASVRFKLRWAKLKGTRNPLWRMLDYSKDDLPSWWVRTIGRWFTGILVLIFVLMLIPFNPSYWVLTQHTGTIATISNRFVDGTGDVSGAKYTLTLEGDPTPRIIDDSRILGLEVGDRVDMTCSLQWVYGGADQNNCFMRSF